MARIFVADDDPTLRGLLEVTFTKDGHEVTLAADGEEALSALQEEEFDLLILDHAMPSRSGFDVLMQLKAEKDSMPPVMILSAKGSADLITQCIEAGARDFLLKPFHLSFLVQRAYRLLKIRAKDQET